MYLNVICNPDENSKEKYEIARTIYAETGAVSLRLVEAFASMIANAARVCDMPVINVVRDAEKFKSRNATSPHHARWDVAVDSPVFQMCLRVTNKMLKRTLPDSCCGATRFHYADEMPEWAMSLGYVADIDGILFYA